MMVYMYNIKRKIQDNVTTYIHHFYPMNLDLTRKNRHFTLLI